MNSKDSYIKEILQRLGITALTPMQETSLDVYKEGKDMVLLSPTGSGKTLAYLLPLVQSLRTDIEGVQAVILVPSRELALQIEGVFKSMGTSFRIQSCYGGRPAMDENRTLKGVRPHVVVATPGRMNDHLGKGNIISDTIQYLFIDEFDKCLELGFQEEMGQVIQQLPELRRRFLLSATNTDLIPRFVGVSKRGLKYLDFLPEVEQISNRIRLYEVKSPEKDKLETLYQLLCVQGNKSSLIFVNYREAVERVGKFLREKGIACESFHGGMEQHDRERALYKFSNGSCNVFVATDLAARGLDIPEIDNIIHYHLPLNEDAYIHRNGRTARWEAEGNAYTILGPEEEMPAYVQGECDQFVMPQEIPAPSLPDWVTLYIGKGKKDKINKIDIVGFLYKKGGLTKEDIGRIDRKSVV